MKKLFMILLASAALASCAGSNQSEANRGDDTTEATEPSASDTTNTMKADTTATTTPEATPSN